MKTEFTAEDFITGLDLYLSGNVLLKMKSRLACITKIVSAVTCSLCVVTTANASTELWEAESVNYSGVGKQTCGGDCHGIVPAFNLAINDFSVANGATDVTLSPPASAGTTYSWRSRVSGSSGAGSFINGRTGPAGQVYDFPQSESTISFDYCIGIENSTDNRRFQCDSVVVTRDAIPNKPPVSVDDQIKLLSFTESQLLDVLSNDSDDQTPLANLTIQITEPVTSQGGQLDVIGAQIKYTPPASLTKNDSFSYRLFDAGNLMSETATVTLVVPVVEVVTGKSLYNQKCAGCHGDGSADSGIPGAPKLGDDASWIKLLTEAPTGIETLVDSVINGKGTMPAFGTSPNSRAQLLEAVKHLTGGVSPVPEPVNLPPTAQPDTIKLKSTTKSQFLDVLDNDSDDLTPVAKLQIQLTNTTTEQGGQLDVIGAQIKYTPPSGLTENDSFGYRVIDAGNLISEPVTVSLLVPASEPTEPNLPPKAKADTIAIVDPSEIQFLDVLANDSDPEGSDLTIILSGMQSESGGNISVTEGNEVRYSPPPNLASNDSFKYRVADKDKLESDEVLVTLTLPVAVPVPQPNEPPIAQVDEIIFVQSSGSQTLNLLDNDTDPESKGLSISLESSTTQLGGSIALADNATRVLYTAPEGLSQKDSFSYHAVDPEGLKSETTLVTIVPSDTDNDGVVDLLDNCDLTANPGQEDMDSDNLGDACDPDPDGDGQTGTTGQTLTSGKALVEAVCIVCHLNPAIGAPQFGDEAAWNERVVAAQGIDNLVLNTINGLPGTAMPAFGDRYNATELTAAVLYLSGNETDQPSADITDTDGDGIDNAQDNCARLPNTGQSDADGNGVGDACEPTADKDGDGYIFALDDDDSNANRLPGTSSNNANSAFFTSDRSLALGQLAMTAATSDSAGILLQEAQFLTAASIVYPAVQPVLDSTIANATPIVDIQIDTTPGDGSTLTMQLLNKTPSSPQLKIYHPAQATWSDFNVAGIDAVASAPLAGGTCPVSGSNNYTPGLRAGLSCIRLDVVDGGPNDTDATPNGTVLLIARIGTRASDDPTGGSQPDPVDSTSSKGSGGTAGVIVFLLMVLQLLRRRQRLSIG